MTEEELRQALGMMAIEVFELSEDLSTDHENLKLTSLGDSLQVLEFLSLIETRLQVSVVPPDDYTFGQLVQELKDRKGGRQT
jgi:hypothetical protein